MQMACVLVIYSATANSCGIGSQGFAGVILIKTGNDHAHATPGQFICDVDQFIGRRAPEQFALPNLQLGFESGGR